jgi:hypothetical protein
MALVQSQQLTGNGSGHSPGPLLHLRPDIKLCRGSNGQLNVVLCFAHGTHNGGYGLQILDGTWTAVQTMRESGLRVPLSTLKEWVSSRLGDDQCDRMPFNVYETPMLKPPGVRAVPRENIAGHHWPS